MTIKDIFNSAINFDLTNIVFLVLVTIYKILTGQKF